MRSLFQNLFRRASHGRRRSLAGSPVTALEKLEPRLALAGDVSRPLLERATNLYMDPSMHGPQPVVMSKSQVVGHDVKSFVISRVPAGSVVEKLDTATNTWVDVSTKPTSSNPRELLRLLKNRLIQQGDSLRWTPKAGTESSAQQAFEMIGWDDGSELLGVSEEVPGAVQDLVAAPTNAKEITVTWDAPSRGDPSSYTVTMKTTPLDPKSKPTKKVTVTAQTSFTASQVNPYDDFTFEVSASNESGSGHRQVIDYASTTAFAAIASFTMNPTAMLAASDGSVWISYEDSTVPTVLDNIINDVTPITLPSNLPPQIRQYVLSDGVWEHQTTVLTEGVSYGLAEDKNGDVWTANNTSHQSWYGHLFPNAHTTGVVQQITSVNGSYEITDPLDLAGGPLPETLIATPDGDLYVGVFGSGLANGIIQGVSDSSGTWEVFTLNVGPFMHPIVGLAAAPGELWALESVPAGHFWDLPAKLSTHSIIHRINLNTLGTYFKLVSPGARAVAILPDSDPNTSSVAITDHHRVLRVKFNGHHLKHDGSVRFDGRVTGLSYAADGSLWASSRGTRGGVSEELLLTAISSIAGLPAEIFVEIEQALGKLPEPTGTPGFIQQVWSPGGQFAAGDQITFPSSSRIAEGIAPLTGPLSSGMWVRSANQPLFLPSAPFSPDGLNAVLGSEEGQVTLSWDPPETNGGSEVLHYAITASQGETMQSKTVAGTDCTFDGFATSDLPIYFTITATNFYGTSHAASLFIDSSGNTIPEENLAIGFSTDNTPVPSISYIDGGGPGGIDDSGNTYSWEAMGDADLGGTRSAYNLLWNDVIFNIGSPNQPDVVKANQQTIQAHGEGNIINLAAAGVNGNQENQEIVLNFTDGTTETWVQSFTDWCNNDNVSTPTVFEGESVVSMQMYLNTSTGSRSDTVNYIYGYSYPLPDGKTLENITLPDNKDLRIVDASLSAYAPVEIPNEFNTFGISTPPWQVANHQGFDGNGNYYDSYALAGMASPGGAVISRGTPPEEVTMTWAGAAFALGPTPTSNSQVGGSQGPQNVVHAQGQTISMPSGNFASLLMIGAGANGTQADQTIGITFSDGSTANWTQTFTDWCNNGNSFPPTPGSVLGESTIQSGTRLNQMGNVTGIECFVYGYDYDIPEGKTLTSVTLPNNSNVGILGMALVTAIPSVPTSAPQNLTATPVSLNGLNIVWSRPEEVYGGSGTQITYEVTVVQGTLSYTDDTTATTLSLPQGLLLGNSYTVTVQPKTQYGDGTPASLTQVYPV